MDQRRFFFSRVRNLGVNIESRKKVFVKYMEWYAHLLRVFSVDNEVAFKVRREASRGF